MASRPSFRALPKQHRLPFHDAVQALAAGNNPAGDVDLSAIASGMDFTSELHVMGMKQTRFADSIEPVHQLRT